MANTDGGDAGESTIGVEVLLFISGIAVLAYVGGAYSASFRTFPYPQLLERPFQAIAARKRQQRITQTSLSKTGLWHATSSSSTGVTRYTEGKATEGYTLYTSAPKAKATLLNMEGEVVHEWQLPFREAWDDPPHVDDPVESSFIYWRRAYVFPNGDLLASYAATAATPYGYGLVKVDEDSNVVWKFAGRTHHDFDIARNGAIYVLAHDFRDTAQNPVEGVPQMPNPVLDDYIVRLSPDGKEQARISLLDTVATSKYRAMLDMFPVYMDLDGREKQWDALHANTLEIVGADFAEHHDFAEPDHLMVSFRSNDAIGVIDPQKGKLVWAARGFWWQQHHPEPLDNGHILIFDNNGHGGPGRSSRIVEFDPSNNAIEWAYDGTEDEPFSSQAGGSHQALPDGHVLVTSSLEGRLFEVTRSGEIVWEYYNPVRRTEKGQGHVPTTCSGTRIPRDRLTFLDERSN